MEWVFSDGTVVRLGGEVEGASLFAQRLREDLSHPNANVSLWRPEPCPREPIDLLNPLHIRCFIDSLGLKGPQLTNAPVVERPKFDPTPTGVTY